MIVFRWNGAQHINIRHSKSVIKNCSLVFNQLQFAIFIADTAMKFYINVLVLFLVKNITSLIMIK